MIQIREFEFLIEIKLKRIEKEYKFFGLQFKYIFMAKPAIGWFG